MIIFHDEWGQMSSQSSADFDIENIKQDIVHLQYLEQDLYFEHHQLQFP